MVVIGLLLFVIVCELAAIYDRRSKLRGCAYYNILIPLRQQKKGTKV